MNVSYKKLWKLLIDKDMMKKDLQKEAGISWATLTKMSTVYIAGHPPVDEFNKWLEEHK